mmetsp:Transcript_98993/g.317475  ORF Transcript_98993/g.317475 Transcript_98993/m.317475 type:complete len:238 (-) Transcript_98993:2-715(-)
MRPQLLQELQREVPENGFPVAQAQHGKLGSGARMPGGCVVQRRVRTRNEVRIPRLGQLLQPRLQGAIKSQDPWRQGQDRVEVPQGLLAAFSGLSAATTMKLVCVPGHGMAERPIRRWPQAAEDLDAVGRRDDPRQRISSTLAGGLVPALARNRLVTGLTTTVLPVHLGPRATSASAQRSARRRARVVGTRIGHGWGAVASARVRSAEGGTGRPARDRPGRRKGGEHCGRCAGPRPVA